VPEVRGPSRERSLAVARSQCRRSPARENPPQARPIDSSQPAMQRAALSTQGSFHACIRLWFAGSFRQSGQAAMYRWLGSPGTPELVMDRVLGGVFGSSKAERLERIGSKHASGI